MYSLSSGNIVLDYTIPVEDLTADSHLCGAAYLRSFGLFDGFRKANASLTVAHAHSVGRVSERDPSQNLEETGDPIIGLSVIAIGAKVLIPAGLRTQRSNHSF